MEKLWLFSRDKGNKIDMWMIKIAIKANQIDMSVCLFQSRQHVHTKTMYVPKVRQFRLVY